MPSLLPVNDLHLRFSTYPDIGQYCHMFLRVAWPRKHGYSHWNSVPMLSTGWDMGTSGLKEAILDFILPVRSYHNTDSPIGLLDLKNTVITVWVSFLSCLQAHIEVFPVLMPPPTSGQVVQHPWFFHWIGGPKENNLACDISCFCFLRAEIWVKVKVPVSSPPSWISTSGQAVQKS